MAGVAIFEAESIEGEKADSEGKVNSPAKKSVAVSGPHCWWMVSSIDGVIGSQERALRAK